MVDNRNLFAHAKLALESGDYQKACENSRQLTELEPTNAEAYLVKGLAESQLLALQDAVASFERSIELKPDQLDSFYHLAMTHAKQQNFSQASAVIQQGLAVTGSLGVRKDWFEPLSRLFYLIGDYESCIDWCSQHLAISPDDIDVLKRLGSSLSILQRPKEALDAYSRVLSLQPNDAQLHVNLSSILRQLRELKAAQNHLEMASRLDPKRYDPVTLFMLSAAQLDFAKRSKYARDALHHLANKKTIADPFSFFFLTDDPQIIKAAASSYSERFPVTKKTRSERRRENKKIRIGYMSADFKDHATSYLIDQLIKEHSREQFEIVGFDFSHERPGRKPAEIKSYFDNFIDLMTATNEEAAEKIASQSIDILIDLKGFTENSRPQILAFRPCEIQVNYLGYPGTTGFEALDYIIGDTIVFPSDSQNDFSEYQVALPCCYQPNNQFRSTAPQKNRDECGLPENKFVFSCFNHHWKMTEDVLTTWSEILTECPDSVIWLMEALTQVNVAEKFQEFGIEPSRVIMAPMMPINEHLSRLKCADLFLDTFPCGAHTTASDSIYGGVPVLTLMGQAFHSRVSASLMAHAGCPEFICSSLEEYKEKAIHCYQNPEILKQYEQTLLDRKRAWHPYNLAMTRLALESAYLQMLKNGKDKAPIKIDPW